MIEYVIGGMGIGRIILGLAPFVAAGPSSKLIGFPATHDNATARLMSRFFGVRDIGLGVLVFYALAHPAALAFLLLFNALTDFGDLIAIGIPLARRQGIDRGAWTSAAFALPAGLAWLVVLSFVH
ncbi:MAG: DUF4267 domain-containing protein [Polyangiaceae bacterium]